MKWTRISVFTFLLGCCFELCAQLNTYTFLQDTIEYPYQSLENVLGNKENSGLISFLNEDGIGGNQTTGLGIPIGFTFKFNGEDYDRFGVVNTGWVALGKSQLGNQAVDLGQLSNNPLNAAGPANEKLRPRISALGTHIQGNGINTSLTYQTLGESPNRSLVVRWSKYVLPISSTNNYTKLNFQIVLNEHDNSIEIQYGDCLLAGINQTFSCYVGVGGFTTADFINRKTPASHNWNLTVGGTKSDDRCVINSIAKMPVWGTAFKFIPPVCAPVTLLRRVFEASDSLVVSWNRIKPIPLGYQWALTQNSTNPTLFYNTADSVVSFSGLLPDTDYYFHLRTQCSIDTLALWNKIKIHLPCESYALPFLENFDTTTGPALPSCFLSEKGTENTPGWIISEENPASPPNHLYMDWPGNSAVNDWVWLPTQYLEEDTTYLFTFDYVAGNAPLYICLGQTPIADSMAILDTLPVYDDGAYQQFAKVISVSETSNYFIGFHTKNFNVSIDNIYFNYNSCDSLINLHPGSVGEQAATIHWQNAVNSQQYEYYLVLDGEVVTNGIENTTIDSVTLTGLTSGTQYQFFIRNRCDAQEQSLWQLLKFSTRSAIDECTNNTFIIPASTADCNVSYPFSTYGATASAQQLSSCGSAAGDDVWVHFKATNRTHRISVHNGSSSGGGGGTRQFSAAQSLPSGILVAELYKGNCADSLILCDTIQPILTKDLNFSHFIVDSTYTLRIYSKDLASGGKPFDLCITSFLTPVNDACSGAIALPVSNACNPVFQPEYNLGGCIKTLLPVSICDPGPYYDIWFKFIATDTAHLIEALFRNSNGVVELYDNACVNPVLLKCQDTNTSEYEIMQVGGLIPGNTYWVRAYDAANNGPNCRVSMCIKNSLTNDLCEGAVALTTVSGFSFQNHHSASTGRATGSGSCNNNFADDDVWYKFIAEYDTHLIKVIPTLPNPQISTPIIELMESGCVSTGINCSENGEYLATQLVPGQTYYFRIYSKHLNTGKGSFRVGVSAPPAYYKCTGALEATINSDHECDTMLQLTMKGVGIKNEVWAKFTASGTSHILQCDGTNYGTPDGFSLWSDCSGGTPLAQAQDYGVLYYKQFIPGNTYFVRMSRLVFPPSYQYFQDTLHLCIGSPVDNDECLGAIALNIDTVFTPHWFSNALSTPTVPTSSCMNVDFDYDVWFKFIARSSYHRVEVEGGYYQFGEIFESCGGEKIACFQEELLSPKAIAELHNLQIGSTYYIKLASGDPASVYDSFSICILDAPQNDYCKYATELIHSPSTGCFDERRGSLHNATASLGRKNVWYKFTASDKRAIIKVKSLSGFDPGVTVWNASTGIFLDQCTYTELTSSFQITGSYESEFLSLENLIEQNTYYIEIYNGFNHDEEGDFSICLSSSSKEMQIHEVICNTYAGDTLAPAGTWHQAVSHGKIVYSGERQNVEINHMHFSLRDTSLVPYIKKAYLFFDAYALPFNLNTPELFDKFGKSGSSIATGAFRPPILFAETEINQDGSMDFAGIFALPVLYGSNSLLALTNQHFYVVFDLACYLPEDKNIYVSCQYLSFTNGDFILPVMKDTIGMSTVDRVKYHTKKNGNWHDADTWMCDEIPPDHYAIGPIEINHSVYLDDTVGAGDLTIHYRRKLLMKKGAELEIGRSSLGDSTGFSNKLLDVTEGSLIMDSATLIVNGSMYFGKWGGDPRGNGQGQNSYFRILQGADTIVQTKVEKSYHSVFFCIGPEAQTTPPDKPTEYQINSPIELFVHKSERSYKNGKSNTVFGLRKDVLTEVHKMRPRQWRMKIEIKGRPLVFDLQLRSNQEKVPLYTMPGKILVSTGEIGYYTGTAINGDNSTIAVSILGDNIMVFLNHEKTKYALMKSEDEYILYDYVEDDLKTRSECGTPDIGQPYSANLLFNQQEGISVINKCIKVQLEVENDIVINQGGVLNTYQYLNVLFQQVKELYAQDSINLVISEMLFWTSQPSPYSGLNAHTILEKFSDSKASFNGDLALFVSNQMDAGYAYINGLCHPTAKFRCGFASWTGMFQIFPQYSWPVAVIAHELGHLLGARHTHACVWNGNGTALDGCYPSEGNCTQAAIPAEGGTIMSYCHYAEEGIHFSNGFGAQPRSVVWHNISKAACVNACESASCDYNSVKVVVMTDQNPQEMRWNLEDESGEIIAMGGPYSSPQTLMTHELCLPDGCYRLKLMDETNSNPGGVLDIVSSTLIFDGNDGTSPGSRGDQLRILSSNFHFEDIKIVFLDPASEGNTFTFAPFNSGRYKLNGILKTGGGDDSYSLNNLGFLIRNVNHLEGFGIDALLHIDSMCVSGGLFTQNRHTSSGNSFNWCGNLYVAQDSEVSGNLVIDGSIKNNGVVTISKEPYRALWMGGDADIGNQYLNSSNKQVISGTGIFRDTLNGFYSLTQANNRINRWVVNNSKGVRLLVPLTVTDNLTLRNGIIHTDSMHLLTIGQLNYPGNIFADAGNTSLYFIDDTTRSVNEWEGGWIMGPLKRYFSGATLDYQSLLPIGDSIQHRTMSVLFNNSSPGSLKALFFSDMPDDSGLPLYNEQGTHILQSSPSGYWSVNNTGCTGSYTLNVNAENFKDLGQQPISNLDHIRIIKKVGSDWQHSGASTQTGPNFLNKVIVENIIGFDDFGIGLGQDTAVCGLMVYKQEDGIKGSLRYIINECAQSGDTVFIISALDTLYLNLDSLLIDKDLSIIGTARSPYTILDGKSGSKVLEIDDATNLLLEDITINGRAVAPMPVLVNRGFLTLKNFGVVNEPSPAQILNNGQLNISGKVEIK